MGDKREVILFGLQTTGISADADTGLARALQVDVEGRLIAMSAMGVADVSNNLWEVKANQASSILTSSSRTATTNSTIQTDNHNYKGAHLVINVTSITGTPSVVPKIQVRDFFEWSTYYDILEGLPITSTGINVLKIHPGLTPVANVSANDILPNFFRIRMEHGNADAITYTAFLNYVM